DASGANAPLEVTLRESRPVKIPIEGGAVPDTRDLRLTWVLYLTPRSGVSKRPIPVMIKAWHSKDLPPGAGYRGLISDRLPAGEYQLEAILSDDKSIEPLERGVRDLIIPEGEGDAGLPAL